MLPPNIDLFFDGWCNRNPGGVEKFLCVILNRDTGLQIERQSGVIREYGTINQAEWSALLAGLNYLRENDWNGNLRIYGHSTLVINQINGKNKCKAENLINLYKDCKNNLREITWKAYWIPHNKMKSRGFTYEDG